MDVFQKKGCDFKWHILDERSLLALQMMWERISRLTPWSAMRKREAVVEAIDVDMFFSGAQRVRLFKLAATPSAPPSRPPPSPSLFVAHRGRRAASMSSFLIRSWCGSYFWVISGSPESIRFALALTLVCDYFMMRLLCTSASISFWKGQHLGVRRSNQVYGWVLLPKVTSTVTYNAGQGSSVAWIQEEHRCGIRCGQIQWLPSAMMTTKTGLGSGTMDALSSSSFGRIVAEETNGHHTFQCILSKQFTARSATA